MVAHSYTHLKCYAPGIPLRIHDAEQAEETAWQRYCRMAGDESVCRKTDEGTEDTILVQNSYAGVGAAVVKLAKGYQADHPGVPYERAQAVVLDRFPDLARAFATSRGGGTTVHVHAGPNVSPSVGGAGGAIPGGADWQAAGAELSRRAKLHMRREGVDFETAFNLECADDSELRIRYEGRP